MSTSALLRCQDSELWLFVIPAQAGILIGALDSRLRGNDGIVRTHSRHDETDDVHGLHIGG
ncbi:MAG: hypothetical protein ACK526_00025 [Planctomyces sp.]